MDRKTKGVALIVGGLAALAVVLIILLASAGSDGTGNSTDNIIADMPDAELSELPPTKSDAYRISSGRHTDIDEYWDSYGELYHQGEEDKDSIYTKDMFSDIQEKDTGTGSQPYSGARPYRETFQEREERHRRRRDEAMEMAREMAGEGSSAGHVDVTASDEHIPPEGRGKEEGLADDISVGRSEIISSLDWTSPGSGVSSLDDDIRLPDASQLRPFRCMFAKEMRLRNGQRATVILLEDMVVGGVLIPKNTRIMASCRISERLEISIDNIEIRGTIVSLGDGYEAYDSDGMKGIYCPDLGGTARNVRSRGGNILSSRLSGLMGGLARDIVSTGVSVMQSKNGEVTVSIPSGYEFYIMEKKR